jgi:hypothetical protein
VTKYSRSAQFFGRKEATPPEVPNFRFRFHFRLCASFRGGSVF